MQKRNFLKSVGLMGLAGALPSTRMLGNDDKTHDGLASSCVLIPSEMAGPFPLDLTDNTAFFRRDVREDRIGVPLRLRMRVVGVMNCEPLLNARVHMWQCDADGRYSGYDNAMNPGQAGLTYLRGYQLTDANGEVEFLTVFPGWYPGRVAHIHFQVYVSSAYAAISQLTFPIESKQSLYRKHADIYKKGVDPIAPEQDGVFADGYQYQLSTLTPLDEVDGYDSFLEVAVQGTGSTSVGYTERTNANHFVLGQNYPNPYSERTTIPFTLVRPSDVTVTIFDLQGNVVHEVIDRGLMAGTHRVVLPLSSHGIASATYVYQLTIANEHGVFTDAKVMTAGR